MPVASLPFTLHGLGIPLEQVARLADGLKLPAAPLDQTAPDHAAPDQSRVIALLGDAEAAKDPAHWAPPFAAWIEVANQSNDALAAQLERASQVDLYTCVTTITANRLRLAGRIVHALMQRHPLSEERRDDIELALHEAISNAMVHGNLQIEGMKGLTVDSLERFSHELASRMADPFYAERRIEVSCWLKPEAELLVEVADEGPGFVLHADGDANASGRGLSLIAAMARQIEWRDGGRRIRIRFAL